MNTIKGEPATFEKLKDLKTILSAEGPCVSIYMPLNTPGEERLNANKQNELHWKECLRTLKDKAAQFGAVGGELVDSVSNWDAVAAEFRANGTVPGRSIAVFRSPDVFQVALLDREMKDRAVLGPHFYIRPLLAELEKYAAFYLLALSQKNTRLLRCTARTSEEISFPTEIKTSFEEWMNQVKPDHRAVYNAMTTGRPSLSGPNALAPKGSDRNAKNEYLSHYFKQVDRGVNEILKGKTAPLVLCAVEYEIPIYREVNSYPNLAKEAVQGAPNSMKSGEMPARAIKALELCYAARVDEALAEWNHRVGGGASNRLKEVVTAAHDGRVLTLLVSDSHEQAGAFDEASHRARARETGSEQDEDLVNDAAVQTILHSGSVLVAAHKKMPNGSVLAGIFRY